MKYYRLFYSNETDFSEVFQLKKFLRKNHLESKVSLCPFIKASDALPQLSQFSVVFSQQLAEQGVVLPLKLRYTLLVVDDAQDARNVVFVKGRSNIESYLQTNLL